MAKISTDSESAINFTSNSTIFNIYIFLQILIILLPMLHLKEMSNKFDYGRFMNAEHFPYRVAAVGCSKPFHCNNDTFYEGYRLANIFQVYLLYTKMFLLTYGSFSSNIDNFLLQDYKGSPQMCIADEGSSKQLDRSQKLNCVP